MPSLRTNLSKEGNLKAVSPVLATAVLIAITVIAAIAIAGFVFGLFGSFVSYSANGISADITPDIYSSSQNVGVLNQVANFSISLTDHMLNDAVGSINITSGATTVQSQPYFISQGKTVNVAISQQLTSTGLWRVDIISGGSVIRSYAFQVEIDTNQANLVIDQVDIAQAGVTQGYWNLGLAAGLVVLGTVNVIIVAPPLKTSRENKKRRISNTRGILGDLRFSLNVLESQVQKDSIDEAILKVELDKLLSFKTDMTKSAKDIELGKQSPDIKRSLDSFLSHVSKLDDEIEMALSNRQRIRSDSSALINVMMDIPKLRNSAEEWLKKNL